MELPRGKTLGIVQRGNTADRSPFSNRMWRLRAVLHPGAVLVLMPDPVRLRHSRRMLDGFPAPVFLAVEGEAVAASPVQFGAPLLPGRTQPASNPQVQERRKQDAIYGDGEENGWDPASQLRAMDTEGIDIAVLFPKPGPDRAGHRRNGP